MRKSIPRFFAVIVIIMLFAGLGIIGNLAHKKKKKELSMAREEYSKSLTKSIERQKESILSIPVETIGPKNDAFITINTDYIRVGVPFRPTCSGLAKKAQELYNNSYEQGKIPTKVQFYGTDDYDTVPLKLIESGIHNANVFVEKKVEYLDRDKKIYKYNPIKIVCRMQNASFVEYNPVRNRQCSDIVVQYEFALNRYSYGEMYRNYCSDGA